MLCEVLHATAAVRPTFGLELGNTWLTAPTPTRGSIGACRFGNASGWRACVGANVARQRALLAARSPHLLVSAGLMEFLARPNLDDPALFPDQCCVKGSVGQWGSNTTCVPDVTTQCAQDYYASWGKTFLDAGCAPSSSGKRA
jgi:hypothetical protein